MIHLLISLRTNIVLSSHSLERPSRNTEQRFSAADVTAVVWRRTCTSAFSCASCSLCMLCAELTRLQRVHSVVQAQQRSQMACGGYTRDTRNTKESSTEEPRHEEEPPANVSSSSQHVQQAGDEGVPRGGDDAWKKAAETVGRLLGSQPSIGE